MNPISVTVVPATQLDPEARTLVLRPVNGDTGEIAVQQYPAQTEPSPPTVSVDDGGDAFGSLSTGTGDYIVFADDLGDGEAVVSGILEAIDAQPHDDLRDVAQGSLPDFTVADDSKLLAEPRPGYEMLYESDDQYWKLSATPAPGVVSVRTVSAIAASTSLEDVGGRQVAFTPAVTGTDPPRAIWLHDGSLLTLSGAADQLPAIIAETQSTTTEALTAAVAQYREAQASTAALTSAEFDGITYSAHDALTGGTTVVCARSPGQSPTCAASFAGPFATLTVGNGQVLVGYEDLQAEPQVVVRTEPELSMEAVDAGQFRWIFASLPNEAVRFFAELSPDVETLEVEIPQAQDQLLDSVAENYGR